MSGFAHTPGPWTVGTGTIVGGLILAEQEPDERGLTTLAVAEIPNALGVLNGQNVANARLIAAAPDLLEAAKKARAVIRSLSKGDPRAKPILDKLRAAIAKAEGTE